MKILLKNFDFFTYDKKTIMSYNDDRINTKFGHIFTLILLFFFCFFSWFIGNDIKFLCFI